MRRTIIIYAFALATLTFLVKWIEYKYFARDMQIEAYIGAIALLFTVLGIWVGLKIINRKKVVVQEVVVAGNDEFTQDEQKLKEIGISNREYEVLELMSKGMSNQEIADTLFISLSTVKTHAAGLYMKLDVKRRTQAVQRAKELRLIP